MVKFVLIFSALVYAALSFLGIWVPNRSGTGMLWLLLAFAMYHAF